MTQSDENLITDPSSTPVETIVQRIIENAAHASKKVDELEGYAETGLGHQLLSSIGIRLENIGLLAENLMKRLESTPHTGEKNDDGVAQPPDFDHASVEQMLVAIDTTLSGICKDNDYAIIAGEILDGLSQRLFRKNIRDLTHSNSKWACKVAESEEDCYQ